MPKTRASLTALAVASVLFGASCQKPIPPPDPDGNDLVKGAIVAAEEQGQGYRVYKIIRVDQNPPPIGAEYHFIAYDPKAPSYEEARSLYKNRSLKVILENVLVRKVLFMRRDHRVIGKETVTEAEQGVVDRARR